MAYGKRTPVAVKRRGLSRGGICAAFPNPRRRRKKRTPRPSARRFYFQVYDRLLAKLNRNVFSADFPSYRVNFSSNIADIIVKIALSDEKSTQKSTTI
jgi:hypothetical protein